MVGFEKMYSSFFPVHFDLSLPFVLPSPKICDFYFDKTEKKAKELDPFFLRSEKWDRDYKLV